MARATGNKAGLNRPLQVLIAGCGTGRHALMAAFGYGAKASVLAVDISAKSLGYAARLAGDYQTGNLSFAQADLQALDGLPLGTLPEGGFDVIESVGVLHHLPDTAAGLKALVAQLKPGGLIQLGLYRRAGREHVAQARAEIEALGLDPTRDDDIRAFRAKLLADPEHPIFSAIAHNRDFYSLPGCRDLLFHARERDIDLDSIKTLLEAAGLTFQAMQMPDGVLNAFTKEHGQNAMGDLSAWQAFETTHPNLFDAMYRFWAIKRAG
jgi:Methylase involved in ubiquinone/menaquinone biosynthesis